MLRFRHVTWLTVSMLVGCVYPDFHLQGSSAGNAGAGQDSGGSAGERSSSGGKSSRRGSTAGNSSTASGGTARGGSTAASTAGTTGIEPVGGTSGFGGNSSTGGTSATAGGIGGLSGLGGTTSLGGSSAKGGTTSIGGSSANGGSSTNGGTTAKGGTSAKGGTTSIGGSSTNGGTTSGGGSSPGCSVQLLANPNFELGETNWIVTSVNAGILTHENASYLAQTSPYFLWFGFDNGMHEFLEQTVTLPANFASAKLSFFYKITSKENTNYPFDTLSVSLFDANSGEVLDATDPALSNADRSTGWKQWSQTYQGAWAGRSVRIELYMHTDQDSPTDFMLDTFAFVVNPCN